MNGLNREDAVVSAMTHNSAYAAELRGICKIYGGGVKKANNNINLSLGRGEILCVAGENGAGKTTLMKILAGIEAPTAGVIYINGKAARIDSPLAAKKLGIGMVHQHFMIFPEYTVAENIVMGMEPRKWGLFCDTAKARAIAAAVIRSHHFSIEPDRPARSLSVGEMQQTEICRLLYRNADIIILDEPTSVLTEQETNSLFQTLKVLAASGKSMILITHKLREIKLVAGRVAVLRKGEMVGVRDTSGIDEYEISRMMIGGESRMPPGSCPPVPRSCPRKADGTQRPPVIAFDRVTVLRRGQERPLLDRLSFAARPGEILGFAGVGGNGLGVIEAVLGGFLHPASGTVLHNGQDVSRLNIRALRAQGLAYVPADRLRVGSALGVTVAENLMIGRRRQFARRGFLNFGAIREFADALVRRYNITGAAADLPSGSAAFLSGGNLQKLILAREIDLLRDYIVFSEPSWGLDIAGRDFVWGEIAALRERGAAVILISTDLDEILGLSDRIIVMYRGRAACELANDGGQAVKERVGGYMQGLSPNGAGQ
jgi:simple sugar transport system ATP-binding protein